MKVDITTHHGKCDFCNENHILIAHYNYSKQPNNSYKLCSKCLGQGLVAYMHPLQFSAERVVSVGKAHSGGKEWK